MPGSDLALYSGGPINGLIISNNKMINVTCESGTSGGITATGYVTTQPVITNLQITNNTITQLPAYPFPTSLANGIYVSGMGTSGTPAALKNVIISGNTISGSTFYSIAVDDTANCSIIGNTISDCYGEGIFLGPGDTGSFIISNNPLYSSGQATPTQAHVWGISPKAAIDIEATGVAPFVAGNICLAPSLTTSVGPSSPLNTNHSRICNNFYGSKANFLQYFIYAGLPK